MGHFTDEYANRVNTILHRVLTPTWFYKQEIIEVPGVVTAILITYDEVRDDSHGVRNNCSWDDFQQRLWNIKGWRISRDLLDKMVRENSPMVIGGWEGRTIYIMRAGSRHEHWTADKANDDILDLMMDSGQIRVEILKQETENLREIVPPGPENFKAFEHIVRVVFNYLFSGELGEGEVQSRTQPEDEGGRNT